MWNQTPSTVYFLIHFIESLLNKQFLTMLKMLSLLSIAVFLLSITPTATKVVESMSQCKGFILDEIPPNVPDVLKDGRLQNQNRYKPICQTYKNVTRFLTLYDTENKIPVFSAAKFKGSAGKRPKRVFWKIEPQLENINSDKNMQNCNYRTTYNQQASNRDYNSTNRQYDRGHLFPASFGFRTNNKIATFTLTNIVPQAMSFNSGSWGKMETYVKCILEHLCQNPKKPLRYVLTGARPSPDNKLNDKVNIPSMLWSAFCCYSHKHKKWLSGAFWRDNVPDKSRSTFLPMRSLAELYDNLSDGHTRFEAFPGQNKKPAKCPLKETVEDIVKEIRSTCKYPPHNNISVIDE